MHQPNPLDNSYLAQVPTFYTHNHSPTPILKSLVPHCAPQPAERVKPPLAAQNRTPPGDASVTPEPF